LKNLCASFWARRVNRHGCPVDPARSCRQPGGPATGAGSPGAALLATGSPGPPCRRCCDLDLLGVCVYIYINSIPNPRPRRVPQPPCWAYKSPRPAVNRTLASLISSDRRRRPQNRPWGDSAAPPRDSGAGWEIQASSSSRAPSSSDFPETSQESNGKLISNSGFPDLLV
jgi:hypothetical protein